MKRTIETELGTERQCARCGEYWPLDPEFFNKKGEGWHSYCRGCMTERKRELRHGAKKRPRDRIDINPDSGSFKYYWFWLSKLGDRKNQRLRVLARGKMNSALVEFEDGYQAIVSRNAYRRIK